jgi:glycosyltransferase involved in cell wall biosynthesis
MMSKRNSYLDTTIIQDIAEAESAEVIHFPYNWSFPKRKKVPSVLTIHDVIPFTFREAQSLYINLFFYKPGVRKAAGLNDVVTTVSEYSKRDIIRKLGVPQEKIRVVYNWLGEPNPPNPKLEEELRQRWGLERFVLNVGGIHERKNIPRLIQTLSKIINEDSYPGKLVITGKAGGAPYQDRMRKLCDHEIRRLRLEDRVVFTEFLSEMELDSLFRMTEVMIYPSLYEGFGIPVLEAMKLGVPVVTSNSTALPEVAGDAAILTNPFSVEEMAKSLSHLLKNSDLREELREKGIQRARGFTWQKNTEAYLELYQELMQD